MAYPLLFILFSILSLLPCNADCPQITQNIQLESTFACALSNDKVFKCWGRVPPTELMDGEDPTDLTEFNPTPINFGADFDIKNVQVLVGHVCASSIQETVKCFGGNTHLDIYDINGPEANGQVIPYGTDLSTLSSIDLGADFPVKDIYAGQLTMCALSTSNKVKCWGTIPGTEDFWGALGTIDVGQNQADMGENLNEIPFGDEFVPAKLALGSDFICALSTTNTVKCYGSNQYGQLGTASPPNQYDLATLPVVLEGVKDIKAGNAHVCVIMMDDNKVKCWGRNNKQQLGYGINFSVAFYGKGSDEQLDTLGFINFGDDFDVKELSLGFEYSCAISTQMTMKCWGELWDGVEYGEPTLVDGFGDDFNIVKVSTHISKRWDSKSICVVSDNGELKCLGENRDGQLGHFPNENDYVDSDIPITTVFDPTIMVDESECDDDETVVTTTTIPPTMTPSIGTTTDSPSIGTQQTDTPSAIIDNTTDSAENDTTTTTQPSSIIDNVDSNPSETNKPSPIPAPKVSDYVIVNEVCRKRSEITEDEIEASSAGTTSKAVNGGFESCDPNTFTSGITRRLLQAGFQSGIDEEGYRVWKIVYVAEGKTDQEIANIIAEMKESPLCANNACRGDPTPIQNTPINEVPTDCIDPNSDSSKLTLYRNMFNNIAGTQNVGSGQEGGYCILKKSDFISAMMSAASNVKGCSDCQESLYDWTDETEQLFGDDPETNLEHYLELYLPSEDYQCAKKYFPVTLLICN